MTIDPQNDNLATLPYADALKEVCCILRADYRKVVDPEIQAWIKEHCDEIVADWENGCLP